MKQTKTLGALALALLLALPGCQRTPAAFLRNDVIHTMIAYSQLTLCCNGPEPCPKSRPYWMQAVR